MSAPATPEPSSFAVERNHPKSASPAATRTMSETRSRVSCARQRLHIALPLATPRRASATRTRSSSFWRRLLPPPRLCACVAGPASAFAPVIPPCAAHRPACPAREGRLRSLRSRGALRPPAGLAQRLGACWPHVAAASALPRAQSPRSRTAHGTSPGDGVRACTPAPRRRARVHDPPAMRRVLRALEVGGPPCAVVPPSGADAAGGDARRAAKRTGGAWAARRRQTPCLVETAAPHLARGTPRFPFVETRYR